MTLSNLILGRTAEETRLFDESRERALHDDYAMLRLTTRTWAVLKRFSVAKVYMGVADVQEYRVVFKGKFAECVARLQKDRST